MDAERRRGVADPHADQLPVLRRSDRRPQLAGGAPVQPVRRRDCRPRRQAPVHHLHAAGVHARGPDRCDPRLDARRRRLAGVAPRDDSGHRERVRHPDAPVVHRGDGGQGRSDERDRAQLLAVQRCACHRPGDRGVPDRRSRDSLVLLPQQRELYRGDRRIADDAAAAAAPASPDRFRMDGVPRGVELPARRSPAPRPHDADGHSERLRIPVHLDDAGVCA